MTHQRLDAGDVPVERRAREGPRRVTHWTDISIVLKLRQARWATLRALERLANIQALSLALGGSWVAQVGAVPIEPTHLEAPPHGRGALSPNHACSALTFVKFWKSETLAT